jgi:hypothetical protein
MKPLGWTVDCGMGKVRKWDRVAYRDTRGSRPTHRTDKQLRQRAKNQAKREIAEAS